MTSESENTVYTIEDFILDKVKFAVPPQALRPIFMERNLEPEQEAFTADVTTLRLVYADLLKWMVLGPSKVSSTSDSDNGWSHTDGGYQLTADDIAALKAEANGIYKELEPESVFGKKARFVINSYGIQPANRQGGANMPHIIRS